MEKIKMYIYIVLTFLFISLFDVNTPKKTLSFTYPVNNIYITSGFGYRFLGYYHFHNGTDFAASIGTPLYSIEDGIVVFCGFNGAYGYTVKIKHDNTYTSVYCHVSGNLLVKKGDLVYKNDVIANVGPAKLPYNATTYFLYRGVKSNGMTTGPHLHFSLIKNGKYVDPMSIKYEKVAP